MQAELVATWVAHAAMPAAQRVDIAAALAALAAAAVVVSAVAVAEAASMVEAAAATAVVDTGKIRLIA
jgi:hypothetical protein